ncbi:MAG: glycosyl transferase [Candidatus Binatia bacterium]|nr:MAG: glycosyl transferase [Candidatus Binatia bacterium]
MRPLRVAYVIRDFRLGGGTENHLVQLFERLDRTRFRPSLHCLWRRGELIGRVESLGVPVFECGLSGSLLSPATALAVVRLARLFRRERVDIVHTFLPRGEFVGSLAARLARVPVLLCGKRGCHYRRGAEAVGCRVANYLADVVVANARAVRDFVSADENCPLEKIVVIENGVDTRRFAPVEDARPFKARLGLDPERPVVGTVTRARVRKGYEEFLRAAAEVARSRPEVQVVVVGQDTKEKVPWALVRELDLERRLFLLGTRTDMPEVLAAFDIFVLSSHDEGMSNAIMEAMAAGKPVVATNVGGAPELIEEGVSGLLVPPREVPPLAAAILRVLENPDLASRLGRAARHAMERGFSLERMVERVERLYETLWEAKAVSRKLEVAALVARLEQRSES